MFYLYTHLKIHTCAPHMVEQMRTFKEWPVSPSLQSYTPIFYTEDESIAVYLHLLEVSSLSIAQTYDEALYKIVAARPQNFIQIKQMSKESIRRIIELHPHVMRYAPLHIVKIAMRINPSIFPYCANQNVSDGIKISALLCDPQNITLIHNPSKTIQTFMFLSEKTNIELVKYLQKMEPVPKHFIYVFDKLYKARKLHKYHEIKKFHSRLIFGKSKQKARYADIFDF